VFEALRSNTIQFHIYKHYALADAAQAHRDLESRPTTGSLLRIP
jgi:NADPH2:quinone reductase